MEPWLQQGLLPNLSGLIARGVHSHLRSTIPPLTAPAWTTMMTGTNPGRHGIYDFTTADEGTYGRHLTTSRDRLTRPVWHLLNDAGLSCGVANVPITYPPDKLEGYMMSGEIGAPAFTPQAVHPDTLHSEIKAVGGFPMEAVVRSERGYRLAALDAQLANRATVFTYLLDNHPTDAFIGVVNYVDHLQHFFLLDPLVEDEAGEKVNVLLRGYQAADRLLGQILERLGPEVNFVVASDHGVGPIKGYLNLDRLLVEAGLLHFKGEGRQRLYGLSHRLPLWVRNLAPKAWRESGLAVLRREFESSVDWHRTKLFRRNPSPSFVLNVQGREPEGIIPQVAYERTRDDLIEALQKAVARHPEMGACQFLRREEVYEGGAVKLAADIVMIPDGYAFEPIIGYQPESGIVLSEDDLREQKAAGRYISGSHRPDGIFIAAGPAVAAGANPNDAQIADITPTLLQLAGADIPPGLDGRVLNEILK
jgi:predicted AlkP superfamily phosphohydrolase/phosphomutase